MPTDDHRPQLIDLASRALGGSVVTANDESFGEKENLIVPTAADFTPGSFGHKGEIVDGWETRRRRTPGHDWALIRLGSPGVIHSIDVDTSFFTGNYPEQCRIEACGVEGYPSPEELAAPDVNWEEIVPLSPLDGGTHNHFTVTAPARFTHVRLSIHPDGGVARLRVHGRVIPDPRRFDGLTLDLAAREHGGVVELGSDTFYSSAGVLNLPGLARHMGEGWETRRRRGTGNDWAIISLAAPGQLRQIEVDTSYYVNNASGECALYGATSDTTPGSDSPLWFPLLSRTRLQPDTRHFFNVTATEAVTHVRFDVFPDGGISRLRLLGSVDCTAWPALALRWFNTLPADQAQAILTTTAGFTPETAQALIARRPLTPGDPATEAIPGLRGA
ncbi:allantoicase [Streptomyces sp. NPDC005917]|uniref:allantoicase n=1 Tax=unclassified Streptomyces TaxID=2593676 RepID=UPI0033C4C112